ncbi:hydrogenase subunit MbhD domain-containing protein [Streptomyces sp. SLBN-31]|uniref:Na(+)/H(+) antiporter subunit B n=1 Tax=Streptomyces sp. SLBN-31 TaxID=2768444 RepID=UPI001154CA56|nr:hydrogenase subunit MbhD domain-containing protein [Streptomyces sp. SLBN-31]TQJ91257.1 membrane-bound hydrogenase subunit ehbD [Streptomyces sp. SLBN-31]
MTAVQAIALTLTAALGVAVVACHDRLRQVLVNGLFGLSLVVLFTVLQAPDVAISVAVVSTVAYPMLLLATIYRTGDRAAERKDSE